MIKLLVELPLIGRFTIIIFGTVRASGNGRAGSDLVNPISLPAYSKTPRVRSLFSYCGQARRPEESGRGTQSACATWTAAFCYLRL
jgi:hypothetical protein